MFNFFKKVTVMESRPIPNSNELTNDHIELPVTQSISNSEITSVKTESSSSYIPGNDSVFSSDFLLHDPAALGWSSIEEQQALFAALCIFYENGQSVLDVGCGRCDMFGYMNQHLQLGTEKYLGIDINPNMLEVAKVKFPGISVETLDVTKLESKEFDWVMASGVFNLIDYPDMITHLIDAVDKMYATSKVGIAFNLLTKKPSFLTKEEQSHLATYDPGSWLNYFISKYTKVICRTDYLDGDATFFIFK